MIVRFMLIGLFTCTFVACNHSKAKVEGDTLEVQVSEAKQELQEIKEYPEVISKVFKAHGGIDQWEQMNNLCYEFTGRTGNETHTISLKDRRVKLEADTWSIGYDGTDVWLLQNEADAYKGNARFYHNLIFYFYAMPFVLGDDGITYTEIPETVLVDKIYKGVKISYGSDIGDSPDDEYILFYDPQTYEMEWLGYTVTYGDKGKSDRWSYIKYNDWAVVNKLNLPKELTWYTVENGKPTTVRNSRVFDKITVSKAILSDEVFAKPEAATVAEK